jgi:hypothetical protein
VEWMYLAEDRDRCRAVMNTVENFWVPKGEGGFLD